MAIKNFIMRMFNGSDWDTYYPKTTAGQVIYGESNLSAELQKLNKHVNDNGTVYTHNFTPNSILLPAGPSADGEWPWFSYNDFTFGSGQLPAGEYEASYECDLVGNASGVVTIRAKVNGSEVPNRASRASTPAASGLYTSANGTFRFSHNGGTLGIALQAYGSVPFTPQNAVMHLKRIGDKVVVK